MFVKTPGQKTQRRTSEFAVQTAMQYSDIMVTKHALRIINCEESKLFRRGDQCVAMAQNEVQPGINGNDLSVRLCGKYMLNVTVEVMNKMKENRDVHLTWMTDNKKLKEKSNIFCLDKDLVRVLVMKLLHIGETEVSNSCHIIGYTGAIITAYDQIKTILYAHPYFLGRRWYDWTYVHFRESSSIGIENNSYYPARILGFLTIDGSTEAAIWCSEKPLRWIDVEQNFFCKITLGHTFDFCCYSSIDHISISFMCDSRLQG